MSKSCLKTYLLGLKIIGVLLSFIIPIVIYVSLIHSVLWADISLQRFALIRNKPSPSNIDDKKMGVTSAPLNLDLLPDKPAKFNPEKLRQLKLLSLYYSWDNAGLLSMICFYVFIPFCIALYFPILKFAIKSLKKAFKELKNE